MLSWIFLRAKWGIYSVILFAFGGFLRKYFHKTLEAVVKTDRRDLKVIVIPALFDNYTFLVIDPITMNAAAIDPVNPGEIIENAKKEGVKITHVFLTHGHVDHIAGNLELWFRYRLDLLFGFGNFISPLLFCGHPDDQIPLLNFPMTGGSNVSVGNLKVTALATPCHTQGHLVFLFEGNSSQSSVLFTGDTLFLAGCGKFFSGTAEQMHSSLSRMVGTLKPETQLYCGHEYSEKNLKFALSLERDNQLVKDKLAWVKEMQKRRLPSIPSTLAEEMSYNPFLRYSQKHLASAVGIQYGEDSTVQVLKEIRQRKDQWTADDQ